MFSLTGWWREFQTRRAMHRWALDYKYDGIEYPWAKHDHEWITAMEHKTLEDCIKFINDIEQSFIANGRIWRIRNTITKEVIPGEALGY